MRDGRRESSLSFGVFLQMSLAPPTSSFFLVCFLFPIVSGPEIVSLALKWPPSPLILSPEASNSQRFTQGSRARLHKYLKNRCADSICSATAEMCLQCSHEHCAKRQEFYHISVSSCSLKEGALSPTSPHCARVKRETHAVLPGILFIPYTALFSFYSPVQTAGLQAEREIRVEKQAQVQETAAVPVRKQTLLRRQSQQLLILPRNFVCTVFAKGF